LGTILDAKETAGSLKLLEASSEPPRLDAGRKERNDDG
jgi:hypothetical protein